MKMIRTALLAAALLCSLSSYTAFADVIKTIQAGATDQSVTLRIFVAADGTCPTGITHDESGMDLRYWRHGANAAVAITEATQTVNGAHSDGGFVELLAASCEYRLDLPDAAVAAGSTAVEVYGVLTDHIVKGGTVQLVAYNPQDSVRLGLTALPNAAADAGGGLPISDAGGLDLDAQFAKLGTMPNLGGGATLGQAVRDLAGATFDTSTDSAEAIRNRGDSAWTTGAGGCSSGAVCTTVATAPTTTSVTLTAAPNDDTQPEGFAIYFVDNGDSDSYCLRKVSSVSSGTITYDAACPFTVAAGDTVELLGAFLDEGVDLTTVAGQDAMDQLELAANNALVDEHLDHLLAADYDPASKPGTATALLNELVESDGGVSRFTVNALENGPSGSGASAEAISEAVWEYLVASCSAEAGSLCELIAAINERTANLPDDPADDSDLDTAIASLPTAEEIRQEIEASDALPVARYTNEAGDVCTFIISESTPRVTFDCTEAP